LIHAKTKTFDHGTGWNNRAIKPPLKFSCHRISRTKMNHRGVDERDRTPGQTRHKVDRCIRMHSLRNGLFKHIHRFVRFCVPRTPKRVAHNRPDLDLPVFFVDPNRAHRACGKVCLQLPPFKVGAIGPLMPKHPRNVCPSIGCNRDQTVARCYPTRRASEFAIRGCRLKGLRGEAIALPRQDPQPLHCCDVQFTRGPEAEIVNCRKRNPQRDRAGSRQGNEQPLLTPYRDPSISWVGRNREG
jgi:hypothetical protein